MSMSMMTNHKITKWLYDQEIAPRSQKWLHDHEMAPRSEKWFYDHEMAPGSRNGSRITTQLGKSRNGVSRAPVPHQSLRITEVAPRSRKGSTITKRLYDHEKALGSQNDKMLRSDSFGQSSVKPITKKDPTITKIVPTWWITDATHEKALRSRK